MAPQYIKMIHESAYLPAPLLPQNENLVFLTSTEEQLNRTFDVFASAAGVPNLHRNSLVDPIVSYPLLSGDGLSPGNSATQSTSRLFQLQSQFCLSDP